MPLKGLFSIVLIPLRAPTKVGEHSGLFRYPHPLTINSGLVVSGQSNRQGSSFTFSAKSKTADHDLISG
jgi:hypothetical protein